MNILFNYKNLFILGSFFIALGFSFIEETSIKIDLKGEVKNKGVYKVTEEMTIEDVLKEVGITDNADLTQLNLSKKVYDEMVIIVPPKEEIATTAYKLIENECVCPRVLNDGCAPINIPSDEIISNQKISLNTATKEELMTLSGIGESKALAIIEYRKKSRFNSIEEIMNVKGIGKSIYEKIKDNISI